MRQITEEKSRLQEQLGTADVDLTTGQTIIQELCQLLAEPKELYQRASRRARRTLNKAIFTRLYIDTHRGSRPTVASDELNEHVAPLVNAARHRHTPDLRRSRKAAHTQAAEAAHTNCADHLSGEEVTLSKASLTELANHAFGSGCSSKGPMVDLAKALAHPCWEARRLLEAVDVRTGEITLRARGRARSVGQKDP